MANSLLVRIFIGSTTQVELIMAVLLPGKQRLEDYLSSRVSDWKRENRPFFGEVGEFCAAYIASTYEVSFPGRFNGY